MAKILGVGGIFFKSKDPTKLKEWYQKVLGISMFEPGAIFAWEEQKNIAGAMTLWAPFQDNTEYFLPSEKEFMVNFVVEGLDEMLEHLKSTGIEVLSEMDEPQGKFAHLLDPEGNKIELWEPAVKE